MTTTTIKIALTFLAIGCGALSFGCDSGGPRDGARPDEFRELPPSLKLKTTVGKLKKAGCDNPFDGWQDGLKGAPADWIAMMHDSARRQSEELLLASFLANEENHAMCEAVCDDAGSKEWGGGAFVAEGMVTEVGEIEIIGECPFETIATSMDVWTEGEVGCSCAG